ncbi:MAG: response regulator [Syntrophaceae bacterium]|nr:response regulator [Syntrophaceae bacterium]
MSTHSILLIDPFKNLLNAYRMILGEEQYQVDTTINLKDAYDFFKKRKYSVIITEYIPPYETTDDFIQWVKKGSPEVHILIVTNATIDEKTYEKLFALGVGDIILKPYSPEKILVHIKRGLKERSLILKIREMERLSLLEPISEEIQGLIFTPPFFKKCLRQEIKKAKRHRHPFSLLLIQIPKTNDLADRFESFYADLLKILRKHTREEDLIGRSNGEIGIILPETDQNGSQALMKRLLNLVDQYPSFKLDDVMKASVQALFFQSFTYPNRFELPKSLSPVLGEIDR